MKIRAADRFGFRIDARGFLGRSPSFSLPRQSEDPAATVFPASGPIHRGEVSAGLVFYLN
jgi:hypothetical protein